MVREHILMQKQLKSLNKRVIVIVNCLIGNTIIQVSTPNNSGFVVSAGIAGFKGAKRSTSQAAQESAQIVGRKLKERQLRRITLIFKGFGRARKSVLKGLKIRRILVDKLIDRTSIAHNGCRAKKKRRK